MRDAFDVNLDQHILGIRLCLEQHLRMPALTLIYTGIDVMGYLNPRGEKSVRHDFCYWAEHHMDCQNRLGVSGVDLYAARCGVVHTYTAESRLSHSGEARRIYYAWGDKEAGPPNDVLATLGLPEKIIKIEELFAAFCEGVTAFRAVLDQNHELAARVETKARGFFLDRRTFPGVPE